MFIPALVPYQEHNPDRAVEIGMSSMEGAAYSDTMESIGSDATKSTYRSNLAAFMAAVPDGVFEKYAGIRPKSRGIKDMPEAFVGLARSNPDAAKAAVRSYVKGLKETVEKGKLSPNTVPNKIKPVKALPAERRRAQILLDVLFG